MILYFTLCFVITWTLYFAANATTVAVARTTLAYLGVFTPGILALLLTHREGGAAAVKALVGRLFRWDVGVRWYVFALFFVFSIKLVVSLTLRLGTGEWPTFGRDPVFLLFAGAISSTILGGQAGEELGWRGYALPRLARSVGLGPASLVIGVIWAAWHIPLFFILGADTAGQSFPLYVIQVTGYSVVAAWLYMKTGGSLLLAMLLHAAGNNTKDIVPSMVTGASNPWTFHASPVGWLSVGLIWVCAAWFLFDMRRDTFVAQLSPVTP